MIPSILSKTLSFQRVSLLQYSGRSRKKRMKSWSGGILASALALFLFVSYGSYTIFVPAKSPPIAAAEFFPQKTNRRRASAKRPHLHRRLRGLDVLFPSSAGDNSKGSPGIGEISTGSPENREISKGSPGNGEISNGLPRNGEISNGLRRIEEISDGLRRNGEISNGSLGIGEISDGLRRNGGISNGLPRNGEISKGLPRNGEISKGLRRNGGISKGLQRNGGISKGLRRNGGISKGLRRNGGISKGLRRNGEISKGSMGNGARMAWPHLRDLLLRSDALPETANSIREAAAAWKDLLSAGDEGRSSLDRQGCPISVIGNVTGRVMNVPCGLVQGSAVTVVAVPAAKKGGFVVEILMSELAGVRNGSGIIQYRVSFGGGEEGLRISQNSWTAKGGWGAEERCPSLSPMANVTVDGLRLCNEPAGQSLLNSSSSGHGNGSSSMGANFPFVEGHPFTATLWAGIHGFHMTINGQHETSFQYRKGLEPWVVKGARVAGDVELLSLLASRLPAPEDIDLLADVDKLRAPRANKSELLLLVGVFSTGNNFKQRMALRRSWMQYSAIRSGEVAVRFFAGLDKTRQVNLALLKEAQTYGDIQLMPFVDYYSLLTLKTIAICIFGTKVMPAKYIMKTDDDAFVRIDEITSALRSRKPSSILYGRIAVDSSPHRDQDSKWFVSEQEWPDFTYPPWAYGPGYLVSQDIAKFVVKGHQDLSLQLFKLEDVAMGIWVDQFKNSGRQVDYVNDDRIYNNGCDDGYVLAHYQSPRLLLCLWEKLLARLDPSAIPTCCEY
ncbi:hydroxyproline O-galactosyltransferase GALT3-like [Wolffia australiana]